MDQSEYPGLRSAIERLTLNDSSVTVQRDSSLALGAGWRWGWLRRNKMEMTIRHKKRAGHYVYSSSEYEAMCGHWALLPTKVSTTFRIYDVWKFLRWFNVAENVFGKVAKCRGSREMYLPSHLFLHKLGQHVIWLIGQYTTLLGTLCLLPNWTAKKEFIYHPGPYQSRWRRWDSWQWFRSFGLVWNLRLNSSESFFTVELFPNRLFVIKSNSETWLRLWILLYPL